MNLKNSFRYSNYLQQLKATVIQNYFSSSSTFPLNIKKEHLRSKAHSSLEDEVEIVKKSIDYTPNQMIEFLGVLVEELDSLFKAIHLAKMESEFDIDSAVSVNKEKHEFIKILKTLSTKKDSEYTTQESGYCFNNEGNQTTYYYDVVHEDTLAYDKKNVKALLRKLSRECDNASEEVDRSQINIEVNFSPRFEWTDTLEDALEKYFA